jgi:hypothetical protein
MTGRPGFFGGFRQGDTLERDAEPGVESEQRDSMPFFRPGDQPGLSTPPGFDPVWGTLGAPVAPAIDPWEAPSEETEAGPTVEVEMLGDGFQISGRVCIATFPRISDWLNMQTGFVQVRDASITHLGHANLPDPDHQRGTLWTRLNEVVLIAERDTAGPPGSNGLVIQKQRRQVTIVTPGYRLRAHLHIHAYGSLKQFLEAPEPRFIPLTDVTVHWTSDPALIARFGFALVNREQLISLFDEPVALADEGSDDADATLRRHAGAA